MKKEILMLLLITIIFSCKKDFESDNTNPHNYNVDNTVVSGRFIFDSKESLKIAIKAFEDQTTEEIEDQFAKLYDKGYRSHTPIINPKNEILQLKLSKYYLNKTNNDINEDGIEIGFISDPILALLVNSNNEIIIGDNIYKFTRNKGLFFSQRNDSIYLIDYVNKLSKQENISIEVKRQVDGGVSVIDDKISRYIRPLDQGSNLKPVLQSSKIMPRDDEGEGYSGGGGGNSTNTTPSMTPEQIQALVNNLSVCGGNDNWIQNIFGIAYWCIDKFDSKHRIKTEFWDQNWLFYQSAGVLAKTQRRRFGIWWASSSDDIHLGINRVFLRYTYPKPDLTSYMYPNLFNNYGQQAPIYMFNSQFLTMQGTGMMGAYNYVQTQIEVASNGLPFFDFSSDEILNIYLPRIPIVGSYNINLSTDDIYSQSNINSIYQMGIDFLRSNFSSSKEFVVSYQKNDDEIEVIYFGEHYSKKNTNRLKRRFYQNTAFEVKAAWSDSGSSNGWSFNVSPPDNAFINYTDYELDFYGMARRGTIWRGNRLIR